MFVEYYKRTKDIKSLERDILTIFLIEIFTGARTSDCEKFSKDSICDGFLTYVSKKTHTLTRVPVHKMLPMLLDRMPKKEYTRMTKCRKIKEVAKKLGITKPEKRMYRGVLKTRPRYEYIASHTARRTFVSLMLDKGVPLATVCKLAGHSDTAMTLRYYCSDEIVLNDAALAFFNG
jgi:integrase